MLPDYYLNARWQSSWKINALKMFRKSQDCFEIFLKWNVIFNAFPAFIYCNFTVLLGASFYICAMTPPVFERHPAHHWEADFMVAIMFLAIAKKAQSLVSGIQKPLYHIDFYLPKWKVRARQHLTIISKCGIPYILGIEQIYLQK